MMMVELEAIVLTPYWDSATPPVLTIGVGHTAAAGAPDPATLWHRSWTVGQAISQFETDVGAYAAGVRRAFARPLTQQQFDAAVDFNYHTGRIETAIWVKLFNAGRDRDAEQSLVVNWRSQPERTEAERQLFFHGAYAGDGTALLVPANDRGRLNWHGAQRINIRQYFPHGWRLAA
jgi:lysozyme